MSAVGWWDQVPVQLARGLEILELVPSHWWAWPGPGFCTTEDSGWGKSMTVDYIWVGGVVSLHNWLLGLGMRAGGCPRTYAEKLVCGPDPGY